jgi:DNA helicase-2/ATP-dependent DNA helicase PcrA
MAETTLRDTQAEVLRYRSGWMGISAVPGSGKTWTLSRLAAKLLLTVDLQPDQEILVVTFANSAVDNFTSRIGELIRDYRLLEGYGYRVRTLHGLAGDIIRERPELAGLGNDFRILDDEDAQAILDELSFEQLKKREDFFRQLLKSDLSDKKAGEIMRDVKNGMPSLLKDLAHSFISSAKNDGQMPADLANLQKSRPVTPLFQICLDIYLGYQDRLKLLGAVDFNDLIHLAWKCLKSDPDLVGQLAYRWPYILEDEAQDSSKQQQAILQILAEQTGNWVRVGDTNQAIYQSFTTADPRLLKEYLARPDVLPLDLPESGRSCQKIIDLANRLNDWVQTSHPNEAVRDSLTKPFIVPTKPGDPQQNPPCNAHSVELVTQAFSSDEELNFIVRQAKAWLKAHPQDTVAVLALMNTRVNKIAEMLKTNKVDYVDILMKVPRETRETIGTVVNLLKVIFYPLDLKMADKAFQVFYRHFRTDDALSEVVNTARSWFKSLTKLEDFFYPAELDLLEELSFDDPDTASLLADFRAAVLRWHQAAYLPFDQLMLVISQDLPLEPFELATIHKASSFIKIQMDNHPEWSPRELIDALTDIAKNERNFFSVSENQDSFNPDLYKGKVVLCTCHKAKGLEWDKVFLTSVNNYDYPSGAEKDSYISEKWFIVDRRNLQAEILAELDLITSSEPTSVAHPGIGRIDARNELIRDRLRLLYVGITRAKSSLTISYNSGPDKTPAEAYRALLQEENHD